MASSPGPDGSGTVAVLGTEMPMGRVVLLSMRDLNPRPSGETLIYQMGIPARLADEVLRP